jgi:DNA (cytosine-5)-methyltransferase 1
MGYRVGWACYGAVDVGANHRRERIFIVAHSDGNARNARRAEPAGQQRQARIADGSHDVANAVGRGCRENRQRVGLAGISRGWQNDMLPPAESGADVAHPNRSEWRPQRGACDGLEERQDCISQRGKSSSGSECSGQDVADADNAGVEGSKKTGNAGGRWQERNEQPFGRCTCATSRITEPRLGLLADGLPAELGRHWLIEPDIPRVATGVKNRVDQLKCYGNAVVPQQVYPVLQAIADFETGGDRA